MRGSGLRSRLFWGIGVVVLICVALTVGLGVVFTRHAVENATLHDVSHQADLLAAAQTSGVPSLQSLQPRFEAILNREGELTLHHRSDLPKWARQRLAHHQPAEGTMSWNGDPYYFAARWVNPGTVILLRPKNTDLS